MRIDSPRLLSCLLAGLAWMGCGLPLPQGMPGSAVLNPRAHAEAPLAKDRYFVTSDGVRLHYIEAGPSFPWTHTIVLVPGWTMPAWVFGPQIAAFSGVYHVIAFDPRGQGASDVASTGYEPGRRGQDIAELLAHLGGDPVLLVGWSLGVLDSLAYLHTHGDGRIAGLVLIDNSVGEEPAPIPSRHPPARRPAPPHDLYMREFVRSMFHKPQDADYLDTLAEATLRTPVAASRALLAYPVPRSYWREAVYSTGKPVLYAVRPGLAGQAGNLGAKRPNTEVELFPDAGHALFIDDARRFNGLMQGFIRRCVWP